MDSRNRIMAMEHTHDHIYGIQWHPEVIGDQVGRCLVERIFSLVGQQRSPSGGNELLLQEVARKTARSGSLLSEEKEVCSLHEVDLELRKVVKEG
eukprot:g13988.t1